MTASVQAVGALTGSQGSSPIAEAGQWKETTLAPKMGAARQDGIIKPGLVLAASKDAFIAPTCAAIKLGDTVIPAGTDLREIAKVNPELAQEILNARNEAMKEFFESWAKQIHEHAAADKKSAFIAMLKKARLTALSQARIFVSGKKPSEPNQSSANRQPAQNQAAGVRVAARANTIAAGGVNGAFVPSPSSASNGVLTGRKNRFV